MRMPRSVYGYGKCIVVLLRSDESQMRPGFEVITYDDPNNVATYKTIYQSGFLTNKDLRGAYQHVIDKRGYIYLSHWFGVSRIKLSILQSKCQLDK